jgi:hypothetical protein
MGRQHHQCHREQGDHRYRQHAGFVATETFMSKTDAQAWMEMIAHCAVLASD